jgi:hypothetical protein
LDCIFFLDDARSNFVADFLKNAFSMKKLLFFALVVGLFACKNDASPAPAAEAPTPKVVSVKFEKNSGDCSKACAEFRASYPTIENGTSALRDSVQLWAETVIRDWSVWSEDTLTQRYSIAQSADSVMAYWKTGGQSEMGCFVDARDTVLVQTTRYLSLRMDVASFAGGAHPNHGSRLATFDLTTGRRVTAAEAIGDTSVLLPLLDKAWRDLKGDAIDATFEFYDNKISVPREFAILREGILFHYDPYEVAAYVLGDADIFLTWAQMGKGGKYPFK